MCQVTRRVHPDSLFCCVWLRSKVFVFEFLCDCFADLVADEFLRFLAFKNIAATVNADFCHAFNIVFKHAHHVLQCLFIRVILCLQYFFFYFFHQTLVFLCDDSARDFFHLRAVQFGSAAVTVLRVECSGT